MGTKIVTKDEVMEFFRNHHGFFSVYRVSELLITDHQNIQPEEWQNIRDLLHELKADFLLVKNEGQNIHEEEFSSTPEKVKKYFSAEKVNFNTGPEEVLIKNKKPKFSIKHGPLFLKGIFTLVILAAVLILIKKYGYRIDGINLGIFNLTKQEQNKYSGDIIQDAKKVSQSIIISGWENEGEYLGYLNQITGFYSRHKDIFPSEYETYNRQLIEWQDFFKVKRERSETIYSSEISGLKGLTMSGKSQLKQIAIEENNSSK